jgi:hypothetical protein
MSVAVLTTEEVWSPVPGYAGYEASNLGRIRSLKRDEVRVLRTHCNPRNGYPEVGVTTTEGVRRKMTVHRLVALAFFGPLTRAQVINHKDRSKTNCALSNLEVVSHGENHGHAGLTEWLRLVIREEIRSALQDLLPRQ